MSEDERIELLRAVSDAHASLADAALELRRRLGRPSPLAKTAARTERAVFRFKRELQRFDPSEDPLPAGRPLPEIRQGGKVVDIERLRPGRLHDEES